MTRLDREKASRNVGASTLATAGAMPLVSCFVVLFGTAMLRSVLHGRMLFHAITVMSGILGSSRHGCKARERANGEFTQYNEQQNGTFDTAAHWVRLTTALPSGKA